MATVRFHGREEAEIRSLAVRTDVLTGVITHCRPDISVGFAEDSLFFVSFAYFVVPTLGLSHPLGGSPVEPADARAAQTPFPSADIAILPWFRSWRCQRVARAFLPAGSAGRTGHGAGGRMAGTSPCGGARAGSCCLHSHSNRARACGATA